MSIGKPYIMNSEPGIERDGTKFSSKNYIDGEWCRWYRGLPKKMGGYRTITNTIDTIPRGMYVVNNSPNFNVYIGDADHLHFITINSAGDLVRAPIDRTPNVFPVNINNLWSFDSMFSTVDNGSILIAHAAPNLSEIDSLIDRPVWFGDIGSNSPLTTTGISVSGGIVVLHPYLFAFGNYGNVVWTKANDPTTIMGSARVTATKIISGFATRGGNSSPAGLLWSLDSLIRVTEVGSGGEIEFAFDTIVSDTSILSSKCIVEYDSVYFWAGVDRFLMYNGVVQELPNSKSLDFFFSNLNFAQRQKVWATKVSAWGEIWWHFPKGNSNECNHAIIYNIRENAWYDTPISRSCGYFNQTFRFPIWASNQRNSESIPRIWNNLFIGNWETLNGFTWGAWPTAQIPSYNLLQHEIGTDFRDLRDVLPIYSSFELGSLSWVAFDPDATRKEIDRNVDLFRVEPDLKQTGPMTFIVKGKQYARSPIKSSTQPWEDWDNFVWNNLEISTWEAWGDYIFYPDTTNIDVREQRREMNLKFVSNVLGGNFELGQTLIIARIGDVRQ